MAITTCRLKSTQGTFSVENKQVFSRVYFVNTDSPSNEIEIFNDSKTATPDPVPYLYTYLGGNAYVRTIRVSQRAPDNLTKWRVEVEYGELPEGANIDNRPIDPLDPTPPPDVIEDDPIKRRAVRWIETLTETQPLTEDINGDPITNSANLPPIEQFTKDRDLTVFVIQKNYATLGEILDLNTRFNDTTNSLPVDFPINPATGHQAASETLKYKDTTCSTPRYENGTEFYTGVTRVIYRPETWKLRFLSTGYKAYNDAKDAYITMSDENGILDGEPHKLDSEGYQWLPGIAEHFMEYDVLETINYQELFDDPAT